MQPIRLAVIFDQTIKSGGGYQQALNSALLTLELPKKLVEIVFFTNFKENITILASKGIQAKIIDLSFFEKIRGILREKIVNRNFFKLIKKIEHYSPFEKKLIDNKIDLVYFISPTSLPKYLEELNYITTLWDLCHRDNVEFPEVRMSKEFERRDQNYHKILPRATAILVDSELSKMNVAQRYCIDLERVHIMPFLQAETTRNNILISNDKNLDIHEKFKVDQYIFYPAQFWAHKNHVYILEGLSLLEQQYNFKIAAIFSGEDKGNQKYIESYARKLNLVDRIRFIGFVSNEEIVKLYSQSIALVMPSYFGPTNLPPLEAFQLGVPVLYSDKAGLRDQVGEAALLMDLKDPNSMALHLKSLIEKKQLSEQLISAGYARLKHFEGYNRIKVLTDIIEDFRYKRSCWD